MEHIEFKEHSALILFLSKGHFKMQICRIREEENHVALSMLHYFGQKLEQNFMPIIMSKFYVIIEIIV